MLLFGRVSGNKLVFCIVSIMLSIVKKGLTVVKVTVE